MKHSTKSSEPLYDPILADLYRVRDDYAREFNFDIDAICNALTRQKSHNAANASPMRKRTVKLQSRPAQMRRMTA